MTGRHYRYVILVDYDEPASVLRDVSDILGDLVELRPAPLDDEQLEHAQRAADTLDALIQELDRVERPDEEDP